MAVSVLSLIKNFILHILYFKVKHITEKSVHTHITATEPPRQINEKLVRKRQVNMTTEVNCYQLHIHKFAYAHISIHLHN